MPATLEEVRRLVSEEFPDADITSIQEDNHRINGTIVSAKFRKMNTRERNLLVTEKVREQLGFNGLNVGILFPLAPGESL